MSTHKHFDRICCVVLAIVIAVTVLFINGEKLGIKTVANTMGYEDKLFDKNVVHTMNIIIDDWDSFLETCANEEYTACSVVIDNEAFKNIALRAKGNTSLTNVKNYGNNRYSLKIEFDKYDSTKTYYGLDKLCLNNIIQDNTYLKDYLVYSMMDEFGVASPLCSYVYITVNGEDWGLFLAVEGIEDSFLQRNYGNEDGNLYKPDSQQMGGGKGNGKGFDMDDFNEKSENTEQKQTTRNDGKADTENLNTEIKTIAFQPMRNNEQQNGKTEPPGGFGGMNGAPPEIPGKEMPQVPDGGQNGEPPALPDGETPQVPENEQNNASPEKPDGETQNREVPQMPEGDFGGKDKPDGEMGSDDVKLIYTNDDFSSYSNIFNNAKTKISDNDKKRLIASLKNINENTDIENSVDIESVIRYFVVHNFVLNFDSYTGSMIHNYYLYEADGLLSMIPWDYNLAFGGFQSMGGAESLVNYPVDSPVSGGDTDSRPMLAWIFNNENYLSEYHNLFKKFISEYFNNGKFETEINKVKQIISPYIKKDPTKFCTYEEFEKGIDTLKSFCLLRAESVSQQLNGKIGSTSETQTDKTSFIKADGITISDMGSMGNMGKEKNEGTDENQNLSPPEKPDGEMMPTPDDEQKDKTKDNLDKPEKMNSDVQKTNSTVSLLAAAISLTVLIIGIIFAFFYRRRKQ